MEQKFEIPEMSNEQIVRWYATIKPIVHKNGTPCYLRKLSEKELTNSAYTWLNNPKDFAEAVDYNKLSVIADIKMLHTWGYYGFFKPSVGEVIRQIPPRIIKDVVAFEIICGAIGMNSIYNAELNAGFHVSVVRLYRSADASHLPASPIVSWPTKHSQKPWRMFDKDFRTLLSLSK